ncbi:MAG: MarR family winged helix-turn-helix transcriptional regulator [Nocardioidaceae bacterium]
MPEEQDESLNALFGTVARRLRHSSIKALAPWQVTPSQLRVMSLIDMHEAIRPSELADHLHISPRSVTEVVDSLEQRGLVRRDSDPDDRRASLISLTGEGAALSDAVRAARAAEAETVFGRLSARDRAGLRRILRKLANSYEDGTG